MKKNKQQTDNKSGEPKVINQTTGTGLTTELIQHKIYIIRGKKVMIDRDLALLYDVPTKVLNQAVKRNIERFPEDFMFQLDVEEYRSSLRSQFVTLEDNKPSNLKSQFVTSSYGGTRKMPFAFTEQGIAMLSSVLIGGIERGERNPTFEILEKLAKTLGVRIEDLFKF